MGLSGGCLQELCESAVFKSTRKGLEPQAADKRVCPRQRLSAESIEQQCQDTLPRVRTSKPAHELLTSCPMTAHDLPMSLLLLLPAASGVSISFCLCLMLFAVFSV